MTTFEVSGPLKVPFTQHIGGKEISSGDVSKFWKLHPAYERLRGCYVFGVRAGKGIVPWYVGKTTAKFKGEIFQSDKIKKYHSAMTRTKRGAPVLFLVCYPIKHGKPNAKEIEQLENTLIRQGKYANEHLLNKQKIPRETWSISGVYRSAAGKPSKSAILFRRLLDFS